MRTDDDARAVARLNPQHRPARSRLGLVAGRGALGLAMMLALAGAAAAQQEQRPATGPADWQSTTKIEPKSAPGAAPAQGWSDPARVTIVPRQAPSGGPPAGEVAVTALLTEDSGPIEQGVVWRVFQPGAAAQGAAPAKPRLVGTWREASPVLRLEPGEYLINASFGRAHLTRKVAVQAGTSLKEQFVLNAGGLRLSAVLGSGEPVPANAVSYEILSGDGDQQGDRARIISGVKPGLILRLNAGLYQVVSTYGDANAIVRADVSVEPGKLTEAVVTHLAARVTLKLVTRPGGEAIADTRWTLQTPQGDVIRESMGALPTHILAPGPYVVSARNSGRTFRREFTVEAGDPIEVEVVIR